MVMAPKAAASAAFAASAAATSAARRTSSASHADAHTCPIIASRTVAHVARSRGTPARSCAYVRRSTAGAVEAGRAASRGTTYTHPFVIVTSTSGTHALSTRGCSPPGRPPGNTARVS